MTEMATLKYTRKFYTLPCIDHMQKAGIKRGNHHDKQDLGFLLPANKVLKARQVNQNFKESLTLKLLNDDSEHEKSTEIPANGKWVQISNEYDSVPFVKTAFNCIEEPVVELEYDRALPRLPTFHVGDDEEDFIQDWKSVGAPFVLLSSDRVQMLVPKQNMDLLENLSAKSDLKSISGLLRHYESVIRKYDTLLGLSEPVHQNVRTKYFIKANVHGVGGAYFCNDHVACSANSLEMFLRKNWGPLHEIGHGYEGGFMSQKTKDDISLDEVWNNIYAHSYEVTYSPETGWLYGENRKEFESAMYSSRKNGKNYQQFKLRERLYMHIILKEHTGDNAMIHFNKKYRERQNRSQDDQRRTTDLLADYWSEGAHFDVIPYYEQYGLVISDDVQEKVANRNLESGYVLRDLVTTDQIAEKIRAATELKSIYSIIRTRQMRNKGMRGSIILQVAIANFSQIEGKSVRVMDGEEIIQEVPVATQEIVINDVDAGVYLVRGPYAASKPFHANSQRAIVTQDHNIVVKLNYQKVYCPALNEVQIKFQGLGDEVFATGTIIIAEGKLKLDFKGAQPHCDGFPNQHYASIEILDGQHSIIQKDFQGTTTGAFLETIDVKDGNHIHINHVEPGRLKFFSPFFQTDDTELATKQIDNSYVITKYGLMVASWTEAEQLESYAKKLHTFLSIMTEEIGDNMDEQRFAAERNQIHAAIRALPKPIRGQYLDKYRKLILRD